MKGRQNILLLGASGTIGRATARALRADGYKVTAMLRPGATSKGLEGCAILRYRAEAGAEFSRLCDAKPHIDAVISCLASRSGTPVDAWAVDYGLNCAALKMAQELGARQFTLLSAICVQKPKLAFQHAKLAFEEQLIGSGLKWSIIRPTAYFKSLSGQVARLKAGKPFLLFGSGELTACKPISDADLGRFLSRSLTVASMRNAILPIGGPGPALTPRAQGLALFHALGIAPKFRKVPIGLLDAIIAGLDLAGRIAPSLSDKAELARIGRYYATESMLCIDPVTGQYRAELTPEFGQDRLEAHYAQLARGEAPDDRHAHAVF